MNSGERGSGRQEGRGIVERRQECDKPHRAVRGFAARSSLLLFLIVRERQNACVCYARPPALPGSCAGPLTPNPPPLGCCTASLPPARLAGSPLPVRLGPALQCS